MELLVESVATNEEIAVAGPHEESERQIEAVAEQVQSYLALWRIGDEEWLRECSREIVQSACNRLEAEANTPLAELVLAETEAFLRRWFEQSLPLEPASANEPSAPGGVRAALLMGAPGAECSAFSDPIQLRAAFLQGRLNLAAARMPTRPPETRAMTMKTSLSRLPSIRLIGAWIACIILLVVAFILTH